MSLLSTPSDGVGLAGAKANMIPLVGDAGLALWPNLPGGHYGGHYSEFENGAAGPLGQGLNAWVSIAGGAGAVRTPLTGEAGWFQCAASFETGTATTGSFMMNRVPAAMTFSSTSGLWAYECTFSVPTISDGTNTFTVQLGFFDPSTTGTSLFHGVTLLYTHGTNGGRFQLGTANNGTASSVDTGVTLVAGNYYHIRIEVLNNTLVTAYIKTTFSGSAWADDGTWTSPVATLSTNIPTNVRTHFPGFTIQKSAGTTSRKIKVGHQVATRDAAFTPVERARFVAAGRLTARDGVGQALGAKGTALAILPSKVPGWLPPLRLAHPIVFHAYGRGGWNGNPAHDFGYSLIGGSGSAEIARADGLFGASTMNTGFTSSSGIVYHSALALALDATVSPLFFETVFEIDTLSTSGQQCVQQAGFLDSFTGAPTNGIWIEIDAVQNAQALCKCTAGGTTTSVASGLSISANTTYIVRIVATSTSVQFWIKPDDGSAFGSPVATISTNIPTATALCAALGNRNTSGTTGHVIHMSYAQAFSRSST